MTTRLRFEVDVHLDFEDGHWKPESKKDALIKLNVTNIAATIEDAIYDEYGRPYVTISVRFTEQKED